jgi:hypothetical protein
MLTKNTVKRQDVLKKTSKKAKTSTEVIEQVTRSLGEKKWCRQILTNVSINPGGTTIWNIPNDIRLDVGSQNNRIGNKVRFTSLSAKGEFRVSASWSPDPQGELVRLCVVWDRQCNGIQFTYDQIFDTAGTFKYVHALRQPYQMERFRLLYDKVFHFAIGNIFPQVFNINIPLLCTGETSYISDTGLVGDLRNNNLAIIAFNQQSVVALTAELHGRVRYRDL